MTLTELNGADAAARESLLRCCGSTRWAETMCAVRPFSTVAALHSEAERIWRSLNEQDWLEAFAAHPVIGGQSESQWASYEQSGMSRASFESKLEMSRLNVAYEEQFGFIFIVCATGKAADEMLALLKQRLLNQRPQELPIVAEEQARIMHLRLDKLLSAEHS